jgi:hypothetical protein
MLKYKIGSQDPSHCSDPLPLSTLSVTHSRTLWNSLGCNLAMERLSLSSIDNGPDSNEKSIPADVV